MQIFDIVKIGDATLYHADCREVLPTLGKFDLLLTDPPYGLADKLQGGTWGKQFLGVYQDWDAAPSAMVKSAIECAEKSIVWGGNYYELPASRRFLVWLKRDAVRTMADCEYAWCSFDGNARCFDWTIAATNAILRGAPNTKTACIDGVVFDACHDRQVSPRPLHGQRHHGRGLCAIGPVVCGYRARA